MKDNNLEKSVMASIDQAISQETLKEAYVAVPKKFSLKTEKLSEKVKKVRVEQFEKIVELLNKVSAQLDASDLSVADNPVISGFRSLKMAESYAINDSFLQAQFLENIDDLNSSISMDNLSYLRLARDFGDFDSWQKNFLACARSSRGGYVVTAYSVYLKRYINFIVDNADNGIPFSAIPIIVLDVNKGIYFRDYLNDVESYAKNMMREFNWSIIEERVKKCEKIAKVFG